MKTLDEAAQHDALGERGAYRAVAEPFVPEPAALTVAKTELERTGNRASSGRDQPLPE
jgi:hypothetical protein